VKTAGHGSSHVTVHKLVLSYTSLASQLTIIRNTKSYCLPFNHMRVQSCSPPRLSLRVFFSILINPTEVSSEVKLIRHEKRQAIDVVIQVHRLANLIQLTQSRSLGVSSAWGFLYFCSTASGSYGLETLRCVYVKPVI
jgi:hypothetical protein